MNQPRPERPPLRVTTLLVVAAVGAISGLLAYVIGRGTVLGMIAVFAVIGIGQRIWAHWYRRRHGLPR